MKMRIGSLMLLTVLLCVLYQSQVMARKLTYAVDGAHGQPHYDYMAERVKAFKAATGNDIELIFMPKRTQIPVWAAGGSLPDIVDVVSDYTVQYLDIFQDLRPFFTRDAQFGVSAFAPLTVEAFSIPADSRKLPGAILAVPYSFYNLMGGVNNGLLSKAGLQSPNSLGQNWNWKTMGDYIDRLTQDTNGDGVPDQFGLQLEFLMTRWHVFFRHAGSPLYNRDFDPNKIIANTVATRETLSFMSRIVQNGGTVNANLNNGTRPFTSGLYGFTYSAGPNFAQQVFSLDPNLDVDFIPPAYGPAGLNGVECSTMGVAVSNKVKGEDLDLAWEWIKFAFGTRDGMTNYMSGTGRPPALRNMASVFISKVNNQLEHANISLDSLGYKGSAVRPIIRDTTVQTLIQTIINDGILRGKSSIEQVVTNLQEQANAVLAAAFKSK